MTRIIISSVSGTSSQQSRLYGESMEKLLLTTVMKLCIILQKALLMLCFNSPTESSANTTVSCEHGVYQFSKKLDEKTDDTQESTYLFWITGASAVIILVLASYVGFTYAYPISKDQESRRSSIYSIPSISSSDRQRRADAVSKQATVQTIGESALENIWVIVAGVVGSISSCLLVCACFTVRKFRLSRNRRGNQSSSSSHPMKVLDKGPLDINQSINQKGGRKELPEIPVDEDNSQNSHHSEGSEPKKLIRKKEIHWEGFIRKCLELPASNHLAKIEAISIQSIPDVIKHVAGVLEGMDILKTFGFLHPGLTTKKVLLTKEGQVKLFDFCLAGDAPKIAGLKKAQVN
ncbi:hypothetical protein BSL78_19824 [Apostichopus japonicus]|uniref:Protein kinase domain-containing protein n=1 Tax=Stichopus japonicus TaxID=307972 RepID=A0A2G8K5L1_STIJA|nr:hypothetical protein BSL78_19824 [Apostichopus japonicus]